MLPSVERASGSMTVATRVGFLDTQSCSSGEPLSALLSTPPPPLTFEGGTVLNRDLTRTLTRTRTRTLTRARTRALTWTRHGP